MDYLEYYAINTKLTYLFFTFLSYIFSALFGLNLLLSPVRQSNNLNKEIRTPFFYKFSNPFT
jgi:hypothetical protein